MKTSKKISLLIMPTNQCNMNCVYCYNRQNHASGGIMTLETLKKIYDITFKVYPRVQIIWHGGEPLMAGINFFREAINLQKNYPVKIKNSIQTNLTLLTDEFADFFVENKFGVGSSFDGLQNDFLRGNSQLILNNRQKLIQRGQNCGLITVISAKNIDCLIENYLEFKRTKTNYTFNLYVPSGDNDPLKLNPARATERILEFYRFWKNDRDRNIHVRFFERIVQFIRTGKKNLCNYTSCLGKWLGIRYNGEIFPCNRYFPARYSFGNVADYSRIDQAFESAGFELILTEAIARREKCKNCLAFRFCEGGCNNVALAENDLSENGGSICQILQGVYKYILTDI